MTDQKPPTFMIRFSRELRCGTFEPEYDYHIDLHKLDDERYAVYFDYPTPQTFIPTKKATSLGHREWRDLGTEQAALMSRELAREWVRKKVCRLFQEPCAAWGGNTD